MTPVQLEGSAGGDDKASGTTFDIRQLKKGHTVVIPDPMKHGVKEGKQGYVKCRWGDLAVSCISNSLWRISLGLMKTNRLSQHR